MRPPQSYLRLAKRRLATMANTIGMLLVARRKAATLGEVMA